MVSSEWYPGYVQYRVYVGYWWTVFVVKLMVEVGEQFRGVVAKQRPTGDER